MEKKLSQIEDKLDYLTGELLPFIQGLDDFLTANQVYNRLINPTKPLSPIKRRLSQQQIEDLKEVVKGKGRENNQ